MSYPPKKITWMTGFNSLFVASSVAWVLFVLYKTHFFSDDIWLSLGAALLLPVFVYGLLTGFSFLVKISNQNIHDSSPSNATKLWVIRFASLFGLIGFFMVTILAAIGHGAPVRLDVIFILCVLPSMPNIVAALLVGKKNKLATAYLWIYILAHIGIFLGICSYTAISQKELSTVLVGVALLVMPSFIISKHLSLINSKPRT